MVATITRRNSTTDKHQVRTLIHPKLEEIAKNREKIPLGHFCQVGTFIMTNILLNAFIIVNESLLDKFLTAVFLYIEILEENHKNGSFRIRIHSQHSKRN